MDRVNEFEYGVRRNERLDTVAFSDTSNEHIVVESMDDLLEDSALLTKVLEHFFDEQKPRLEVLKDYSRGNNYGIRQGRRRVEENKSDYRIRHNYGGYISSFVTGYVFGQPITIAYDEELDGLPEVQKINNDNDLESLNYELAYDASRYGRGFELHYRDKSDRDRIVLISPLDMFAIRSFDVENELIGAVHVPVFNNQVHMTIYTDTEIIKYEPFDVSITAIREIERKKHMYKQVPVVEWFNNRYRVGDFETVIPNIDAYDAAQSDTANYMSDLNDATLVVKVDDIDRLGGQEGMKTMTDANVLLLENGVSADGKQTQGSAEYIYKQYDVQGTEAYKRRLNDDIFRLSNIPDMTDEKFGTQSGIAIQYKLIGLKQIQITKENYYTKALRRRYELIDSIHQSTREPEINANNLVFTFHPNLPQDIWAEVEAYVSNGGELSQATLQELASFTDSETETGRLEEEGSQRMTLQQQLERRRRNFTDENLGRVDDERTSEIRE